MSNEFTKLNKLKTEYLHLLKIAPEGDERIRLFKSKSVPIENLTEYIGFLENEITKLKETLSFDEIDVNTYLKNNSSSD